MGKSIRSKTKRTYRAKKRDNGVYAATEAARLERLNAKLTATASKPIHEFDHAREGGEGGEETIQGWSWLNFAFFGLGDHADISPEQMARFMQAKGVDAQMRREDERIERWNPQDGLGNLRAGSSRLEDERRE